MVISNISTEERDACAVAWHKGVKHRFYEDSFRLLSLDVPIVKKRGDGVLFGVFDGIGSAPQGRRAAQALSEGLSRFFDGEIEKGGQSKCLEKLLSDTNLDINGWGRDEKNRPLGGAVGTVLRVNNENAEIFHVGDTRGVIFSEGTANSLTSLHQGDDGAVTRFFGMGANLRIEKTQQKLTDGDRILLCSDGITGALGLEEIVEIEGASLSLKEFALNLVSRAIERGSRDDSTALIYEAVF